jgi:hypothetical protein
MGGTAAHTLAYHGRDEELWSMMDFRLFGQCCCVLVLEFTMEFSAYEISTCFNEFTNLKVARRAGKIAARPREFEI